MTAIRTSTPADGERALQIWRDAVDANDRPTGFMLLDGASMEALFIDPAHRGEGVGRALIAHALALHPALTTEVNEQNVQAVGRTATARDALTR